MSTQNKGRKSNVKILVPERVGSLSSTEKVVGLIGSNGLAASTSIYHHPLGCCGYMDKDNYVLSTSEDYKSLKLLWKASRNPKDLRITEGYSITDAAPDMCSLHKSTEECKKATIAKISADSKQDLVYDDGPDGRTMLFKNAATKFDKTVKSIVNLWFLNDEPKVDIELNEFRAIFGDRLRNPIPACADAAKAALAYNRKVRESFFNSSEFLEAKKNHTHKMMTYESGSPQVNLVGKHLLFAKAIIESRGSLTSALKSVFDTQINVASPQ